MDSSQLPSAQLDALHTVLDAYPGITGMRYLTALGLTALLWDHLLTFSDEVNVIWCKPFTPCKFIFIFLRYGVLATLTLVAYVTSGLAPVLTDRFCKRWMVFSAIFAISTMCVAGYVLIKRVYTLWDHRRQVLHALVIGFTVSYCGIAVFCGLSLRQILRTMHYDPTFFHTCVVTDKPHFLTGVWGSQLLFDIYVLLLTTWNVIERPRRVETEFVTQLKRDGIFFFFIVFLLRLLNVVLSVVPTISFTFLVPFAVWAMVIITLSRLSIQIEQMNISIAENSTSMELRAPASPTSALYGFCTVQRGYANRQRLEEDDCGDDGGERMPEDEAKRAAAYGRPRSRPHAGYIVSADGVPVGVSESQECVEADGRERYMWKW